MKYHNKPVTLDGYRFDSKAEAKRYTELRLLEKNGQIKHLMVHPKYPLIVNRKLVCTYVADFSYVPMHPPLSRNEFFKMDPQEPIQETIALIIEDVKGVKTAAYRIKKKLFEILNPGMVIEEVKVK